MTLLLGLLLGLEPVFAQRALPNPLVQPPKRGAAPAGEGAPGGGAPSAQGAPGAEGSGGAPGAPPGSPKDATKESDQVPGELISRVSSLFVSAIIGDVAVLRAGGGAAATGGGGGQGGGAQGGGAAPAAAAGGAGSSRANVYYVRDAEPFQIFDRFRLLPRVQDTTVVLYMLPDNPQDMGKRPQVVFRGSLDSLQTPSYTPGKVDTGSDSGAYQGLISTGSGGVGGGGGAKPAAGAK